MAPTGHYLNNLAVWFVQTFSSIYHKLNIVKKIYT